MSYLFLSSFGQVMSYIGYIALAILILLVMITVHEFGHYVAGKIFGFGIEEFAVGFGPKIFSRKKKNGEVFSIRVFPIGGFCAFRGEDEDSSDPTAFNNKKWWQRIIVLLSGAFMNYVLAVVVIMLMFGIYGQTTLVAYKMQPTTEIQSEYCFQERDIILSAQGKNIYLVTDLMEVVGGKEKGELIDFTVRRGGKDTDIKVALRTSTYFENVEDMIGLYNALGIYYESDANGQIQNGGLYVTNIRFGFFETLGRSFEYSSMLAGTIFTVLGQLLTGTLGIGSLGGTVTTVAVTADVIKLGGFMQILNMTAFIGVNLAVFNLLPFPALDGSRALFTVIEGIRKKPLNRRVENIIHTIGLFALLAFAIFVDLQHCF